MVMLPCLFILKRTRPSEEEVRPTVEGDRRGKLYPNEVTRRCTGTLTREGELGRTNGIGEMEDFAARARLPLLLRSLLRRTGAQQAQRLGAARWR